MDILLNSTMPVKLIWLLLGLFMLWSWFSMLASAISLARIGRAARSTSEARHSIIDRIHSAGKAAIATLPDAPIDDRARRASAAMHRKARTLLEAAPRRIGSLNAIAATAPLLAALGSALQLQNAFYVLLATKSSNLLYLFGDAIVALTLVAGALLVVIPIAFFLRIYERRLIATDRRMHARLEFDLPTIITADARPPPPPGLPVPAPTLADVPHDGGAWSPALSPSPAPPSTSNVV